jgi:hypothetical protein
VRFPFFFCFENYVSTFYIKALIVLNFFLWIICVLKFYVNVYVTAENRVRIFTNFHKPTCCNVFLNLLQELQAVFKTSPGGA